MDRYLAETPEDLLTADQRRAIEDRENLETALERDVAAINAIIDRIYEDHGTEYYEQYATPSDALADLAGAIQNKL